MRQMTENCFLLSFDIHHAFVCQAREIMEELFSIILSLLARSYVTISPRISRTKRFSSLNFCAHGLHEKVIYTTLAKLNFNYR